jgi:hypothetical protein
MRTFHSPTKRNLDLPRKLQSQHSGCSALPTEKRICQLPMKRSDIEHHFLVRPPERIVGFRMIIVKGSCSSPRENLLSTYCVLERDRLETLTQWAGLPWKDCFTAGGGLGSENPVDWLPFRPSVDSSPSCSLRLGLAQSSSVSCVSVLHFPSWCF